MIKFNDLKPRNEQELTRFLEKASNHYHKFFGISQITFDDLYQNSNILFDIYKRYEVKSLKHLIASFDILVDDFRSQEDYVFEDYYNNFIKKERED